MNFKALVAGLTAAIIMPFAASAVTMVSAGDTDNGDLGTFAAGGGAQTLFIDFVAVGDITFGAGITGVGTVPPTMPNDLESVTFGISFVGPADLAVTDTLGNFMTSLQSITGNGVSDPAKILDGTAFWLVVNTTGPINNVDVDFTWSAVAIPLPAAGWLFLSGLGGMALLARKKRA